MKQVIAWCLCSIVVLALVFQPFLSEIHHLKRMVVEQTLAKEMNQAVLEGRFTPERINRLEENLSKWLLVEKDQIRFRGTTELKEQGELIEAWVEVEVPTMFLFGPFFGQPERDRIRAYMAARSEYIPGITGDSELTEG